MVSNTMFYDGFEGESEIVLTLVENPEEQLHIWEGYFDDIFAQPRFFVEGWRGFTKDYHQLEGVWGVSEQTCLVKPDDYLADALDYTQEMFTFEESKAVLLLIIAFLSRAVQEESMIRMERV